MCSSELFKPLYVQIQEYLAELIYSGELSPNAKLPSERELSQELGVSRMTVRRAITELVNEGLLVRYHGSGTYVAEPKLVYDARELIDHAASIRKRGLTYSSQLLEFSQVPASKRLAGVLSVDIGHPLYRIVKLHLANRQPVVVERAYIPLWCCPDLEEFDMERVSIYDLFLERYGMHLCRIAQTVEAVVALEMVAEQLRVAAGTPLLLITREVFAQDSRPVQHSRDFVRGDFVRIHSEFEI